MHGHKCGDTKLKIDNKSPEINQLDLFEEQSRERIALQSLSTPRGKYIIECAIKTSEKQRRAC